MEVQKEDKEFKASLAAWAIWDSDSNKQSQNELYLPARVPVYTCVSGLHTRGPLDPLESDLQTFVSCHVVQEQSHCF